jgi:hypothetical protein
LSYELLSDRNPLMAPLKTLAEQVRAQRRPCAPDNPFLEAQERMSEQIVAALDQFAGMRDWLYEQTFLSVYGSQLVQAMVGTQGGRARPRLRTAPHHRQFVERRIAELRARITEGGAREAAIRAMLYIALGRLSPDERAFAVLQQLKEEHGGNASLADFKQTLREQLFMLLIDEEAAFKAIPEMTRRRPEQVDAVRTALRRVAAATGPLDAERAARAARVDAALASAGARGARPIEVITVKPASERKRPRRPGERSKQSEPTEA